MEIKFDVIKEKLRCNKLDIILEIPFRLGVIFARLKGDGETTLDSKHTIILEEVGICVKYLGSKRLVAFSSDLTEKKKGTFRTMRFNEKVRPW